MDTKPEQSKARDWIVGWAAALILASVALVKLVDSVSIAALLLGAFMTAMWAPPVRFWLEERNFPKLRARERVVVCAILSVVQFAFAGAAVHDREVAKTAEITAKAAAALAGRQEADRLRFLNNKEAVLAEISEKETAQDFKAASELINRYLLVSPDEALLQARLRVEATMAAAQLKDEDSLSLEDKVAAYAAIASFEPSNANALKTLEKLSKSLAEQRAAEQAETARRIAAVARKKHVESLFSWDGSHPAVTEEIKRSMNNPKSYEHVETRYLDRGRTITIHTTFRGTNAFGGVVSNRVVAEIDDQGRILRFGRLN